MPQGSPELITSFIQFPVTLLSNLPEALIFRGEAGGGQGCWRGGAAHKGEEGKRSGLASEILFLQPSETPAHFSHVLTREGFSYGLSTNFDASWWRLSPCQQQMPRLGTARCPRPQRPTARGRALPPLPSGPK